MWTWKYCSVKVLVQATRTPAATVSFLFLFLNLLVWLLQARQSSTFYEPHSSNGASLPLPTHNIPRTSRKQFCYYYYYCFFFLMFKLLFFYWWEIFFICSEFTSAVEKYKKRKKGKASKRAAAWCTKDRTSLWLGAKSSLLASLAGLDEAKNKGKWKKHVCSTL